MKITSFRFIVDGGEERHSFGEVTIETRPWYAPWKTVTSKRFVGKFPYSLFWRFMDDGSLCPIFKEDALAKAALLRQAAKEQNINLEADASPLRVVK